MTFPHDGGSYDAAGTVDGRTATSAPPRGAAAGDRRGSAADDGAKNSSGAAEPREGAADFDPGANRRGDGVGAFAVLVDAGLNNLALDWMRRDTLRSVLGPNANQARRAIESGGGLLGSGSVSVIQALRAMEMYAQKRLDLADRNGSEA